MLRNKGYHYAMCRANLAAVATFFPLQLLDMPTVAAASPSPLVASGPDQGPTLLARSGSSDEDFEFDFVSDYLPEKSFWV
jgi:hypothetical protein